MSVIEVKNIKKVYNENSAYPKLALKDINLNVNKKEFVCIMGPSGSGKTTLINILSAIDDASSGHILIDGEDVAVMSENQKAQLRKNKIGFIFQNYNLIESLRIKDNILFSLKVNGISKDIQDTRLKPLAKQLNIEDILNKYPSQCSGGQQQRVAIARALIMEPQIIFADEPTGNLDSLNAKELMEMFIKINQQNDTSIIMVTHDSLVASYSSKLYYIVDGMINKCIERNDKTQEQYYADIISLTSHIDLTNNGGNIK